MKVTVFKNIYDRLDPIYLDVITVFRRIKDGQSKSIIETIRNTKDKEERKEIKKRLPSICFSGKFSQRGEKYLLEHSGLICLDIDSILQKDMDQIRTKIQDDEHTHACFTSPSGNGYKVIVKIPPEKSEHKGLFLALENHYNEILGRYNVDQSGKDVSRVCFESYDPFIYQNPDSEIWAEVLTEEKQEKSVQDQNKIIELLQTWIDRQESYHEGNRNNYLSKFIYALCRYGVNSLTAKEYLSNKFPGLPARDLNAMVKSCYAKEIFGSQEFSEQEFTKASKKIEVKDNKTVIDFWNINDKGKVKIDTKRFLEFVEAHGFGIYRHKDVVKGWDFVRKENMIVDVVDVIDIKKVVLDYVKKHAPEVVFDELQMVNRYFDKTFLNALSFINVQQVRDTADKCYIFFNEFYYEITKDGKTKKDYIDLDGIHIWRKQICKKEITEIVDYEQFDFNVFVFNAMGQSWERYKSACSAIGYNIHTYKKYRLAKMVYSFEESMGELDGMANGGSGKNLFQMCLEYVRSVVHVDGKEMDKKDKFKFQSVDVDTQLVFIDDYEGDTKELFNKITGQFSIEKKNQAKIDLSFEEAPKISVNSNNAPKGFSDSFARRLHLLEFSNHYHHKHTPADEFGDRDFFSNDWNQHDYNMLYSMLFECVQMYLRNGLVDANSIDLKEKQLIQNTGRNFAEFWYYYNEKDMSEFQNARDLVDEFRETMDAGDINNQTFYKNCRKMCALYGWRYQQVGTGVNRKIKFDRFVSIKKEI